MFTMLGYREIDIYAPWHRYLMPLSSDGLKLVKYNKNKVMLGHINSTYFNSNEPTAASSLSSQVSVASELG